MDNIRVKEDSLNNWRSGFEIEEGKKKGLDGKACWDGYKLAGTKKKGGKTVDNCVKEDQVDEGAVSYNTSDWRNEFHPTEIESIDIIKVEPIISEEADLENLIVEILEGDIEAMYEHGFSYQEVSEFYDIEEDLTEAWGALARGAFQGAKILATKVAPKIATYVKNRGAKDIKTVAKFARNPQNWSRANKDIDKVGKFVKELPARAYQSGKALRGTVNKGVLEPAKDVADKLVKSQKIANRAINIKNISATKALKPAKLPKVDFKATVPKSTKVSTTATKALKGTKDKVTKGMTPKEIRSKGMNVLAKMQGKTPTQQKAKELTTRMKNAIDKSKKPTTYSGKVDAAKKLPDPQSAVVKGGSTAVATTKVVGKTTKLPVTKTTVVPSPKANLTKVKSPAKSQTIDVKASPVGKGSKSTQSKIKNAKEWMALNKKASVPSDVVTGNPNPPKFTGGKGSLKPRVTVSKDKLLGKVATGISGVAGLTAGVKVGQKVAKGGSSTPPPNENKAIPNTEKKKVDPKKNTVIKSKTTKTEKEKSDENRAKVKANTEKYLKRTQDKIKKYGTSGSHLSPLEQEMAN